LVGLYQHTSRALVHVLWAIGFGDYVDACDAVIDEDEGVLRLRAARWIEANRVKAVKDNLSGLLEMRESPLATALLVGI
jgi:hypothetical protein